MSNIKDIYKNIHKNGGNFKNPDRAEMPLA